MSISMKMNTWRRKAGSVMIYVNNTRHVSIGITPESGIDEPKTDDHKKVIESFIRAIRQSPGLELNGCPQFSEHTEECWHMDELGDLYITDTATIGGVRTGSDGAFLVITNPEVSETKVLDLSEWLRV